MAKAFVIDIAKCSGCYNCQLACKDEHAGNDWMPYAKPQPPIGQFWMKVDDHPEGTIPKVKIHYIPRLCNHCAKPACLDACPQKAIYKREDGFVLIDPAKCTGCGKCAQACPYDVLYKNEELNIFQKCTGCAHLLDNGYKKPRCAEACPTDALMFGEEAELADYIEGATVLKPEGGTVPRVYYRNIPGKFVAGTVYDPVAKEVIIGAKCRLVNGGKVWQTETDDFGDFWFRDLAVGVYELTIEARGFAVKTFASIRTGESQNLGDIPLEK